MFLVMTAFIGGGLLAGIAAHSATATPFPRIAVDVSAASTLEPVGYWKRYCRYNDCTGDANVDVDVDVAPPAVVTLNPPVVVIQPARPVSCGEFRYWDGSACVDARYNKPYLGPR
jgi:hypothetical protein